MRGTRQAAALVAALDNLPGFCSAQQIHAELRRRGEHIGLTTVYRHLQVLSEEGSVDAIRDDSGETLYRQCGTSAHHHHLTCRTCGKSVEVEGRAVEQWAERVARDAGFTDVGHTVELFGLCPDCAVLARGGPTTPGTTPRTPRCAPRPAVVRRRHTGRSPGLTARTRWAGNERLAVTRCGSRR